MVFPLSSLDNEDRGFIAPHQRWVAVVAALHPFPSLCYHFLDLGCLFMQLFCHSLCYGEVDRSRLDVSNKHRLNTDIMFRKDLACKGLDPELQ